MYRLLLPAVFVAVAAAVVWWFPLFHVVPLKDHAASTQAATFDAEQFAADLWEKELPGALTKAAAAQPVLTALADDAIAARKTFGRTVGLSRATYFCLHGHGEILAVEKARVGVALTEGVSKPEVWLATGLVFGNAVRDATGLVRSQDFPNSQNFNALAAALNKLVEERVVKDLKVSAALSRKIDFVACVEVPGGDVTQPLEMIPLAVTIE
jgi:predicted lipoprotein